MILTCLCGRRFRTQTDSDPRNRSCPQCGGVLSPEGEGLVPAVDINVLLEQIKVVRDELVARDRQLRKAQAESTVIRAELDQLRSRLAAMQAGDGDPLPAASTVRFERTAPALQQLPSNRMPLFTARDP